MNKSIFKITGSFIFLLVIFFACKEKKDEETILKGKATLYVDESIVPIIEDQQAVFETQYDAELKLIAKSETEIVNGLLNNEVKIAVLARKLSPQELKSFQQKKINPRETPFANDGVVIIKNKAIKDSLISLKDVKDFLNGKSSTNISSIYYL